MSNETKWTKGPWEVVSKDYGMVVRTESPSKTKYGASRYAAIGGFDRSDEKQLREAKANAHLIAAAPELYETLDAAAQQGDRILTGESPEEGEDFRGWFLRAKAVLAKARGETS